MHFRPCFCFGWSLMKWDIDRDLKQSEIHSTVFQTHTNKSLKLGEQISFKG